MSLVLAAAFTVSAISMAVHAAIEGQARKLGEAVFSTILAVLAAMAALHWIRIWAQS